MDRLNSNQIQHALAYGVMSRSSTRCMANEIELYRSTDLNPDEVTAMQKELTELRQAVNITNTGVMNFEFEEGD